MDNVVQLQDRRTNAIEMVFDDAGEFVAFGKAVAWLKERGYSVGSMQREAPIGVMYGDVSIAKWRNLSASEIAALDGTITGESKRNGPVTISLKARGGTKVTA